jgi:CBS domain-containing protein
MLVKDIMTHDLEWVAPETPILDVARKMREKNIGCMPVRENNKFVGMVTDRDITCRGVAEDRKPSTTTAFEVMSNECATCYDNQEVDAAARMMVEKHIRRLPVLDQEKQMVGMLSLDDLALKASHELSGEVLSSVSMTH